MTEPETLFRCHGRLAEVTLNRPKVLNALSPAQFGQLATRLRHWQEDLDVGAVVIRGAGDRAFSAGGDIRAVWDARLRGDDAFNRRLFAEEYALDSLIHHYSKPYVAFLDGIVMGGGAGVSVNGAFRVATERTLFAMPETAIGFFPDVGATHFLSRMPGRLGLFLGLTGARLGPADSLWAGVATHYVPVADWEVVQARLRQAAASDYPSAAVKEVLDAAHHDPGPAPLAAAADAIERCFAVDHPGALLAALAGESAEWAVKAAAGLRSASPLSVAVTWRQLVDGRSLSFDDCMRREYRLACRFLDGTELYEGIRALVVDKDRSPKWSPRSLEEIPDSVVSAMFESLGDGELRL